MAMSDVPLVMIWLMQCWVRLNSEVLSAGTVLSKRFLPYEKWRSLGCTGPGASSVRVEDRGSRSRASSRWSWAAGVLGLDGVRPRSLSVELGDAACDMIESRSIEARESIELRAASEARAQVRFGFVVREREEARVTSAWK